MHIAGEALLPLAVAEWVVEIGRSLAAVVASDEATVEGLAAALPVFLPDHRILSLPPWDALPYDRGRPSRRVTGTRHWPGVVLPVGRL